MERTTGLTGEVILGQLLTREKLTLAVAESCTGGLVSHRITNAPGASAYYLGSVIAYANDVKERVLGVQKDTLRRSGAVSEDTARQMAQGVRGLLRADLAVAITGILGPSGDTTEKPVGTVHICLASPGGTWPEEHRWTGNREQNKILSADAAIDLVIRYLEGLL
jgi:PncC family amidohydrolase